MKAHGAVLDRAWHLHAIDYKAAFVGHPRNYMYRKVVADVRDISKDLLQTRVVMSHLGGYQGAGRLPMA